MDDRSRATALIDVSRETMEHLDAYVRTLVKWNASINLVSLPTLSTIWTRHIADSLQLVPLAPNARTWIDIGSGAGFPGIVIATCLAKLPGARVHCIERDIRKCTFLREVVRVTGVPAEIHNIQAEQMADDPIEGADAVTARGFSSVDTLVSLAKPYLRRGAIGIFPRGRSDVLTTDLVRVSQSGLSATRVPSVTDPRSSILVIRGEESPMAHD